DDQRGDQRERPGAGDRRVALRTLRVARRDQVLRQGRRRVAQPVRRSCNPRAGEGRGQRRSAVALMAVAEQENPLLEGLALRRTPDPCAMVIFGASGDLAHRKIFPALYSLAVPPSAFETIVEAMGKRRSTEGWTRLIVEKPFGYDLHSARELNALLTRYFDEREIFRIDHYLGKETVQNVLALRFANGIFEPIWNRRYVDGVQISVAEETVIEGRGSFYEGTGAIRDMIQTHLFQTLTFLLMEPPVS